MKQKKINRLSHVGKTPYEKEAYGKFLSSKFVLDKTEDDPIDLNKTDYSSFEDKEIEKSKFQKKSTRLKVGDFLSDNWVVTIIGGFIVAFICYLIFGFINISINQGVQTEKINSIEKNIETINKQYNDNQKSWNSFDKNLEIFKTEISKEIEFIKDKLKL